MYLLMFSGWHVNGRLNENRHRSSRWWFCGGRATEHTRVFTGTEPRLNTRVYSLLICVLPGRAEGVDKEGTPGEVLTTLGQQS